MDEALEFAIDQLESLLLAANSGAFDDDEHRRRCEEALQQLTARRNDMHPEYHAEDPFRIVERIGEVFTLIHYPAGSQKEYAIWRANLRIGSRSFVGEGTSPEYAIRECIQKYVLAFPEGHRGELNDH
jgi:hypothetical protein